MERSKTTSSRASFHLDFCRRKPRLFSSLTELYSYCEPRIPKSKGWIKRENKGTLEVMKVKDSLLLGYRGINEMHEIKNAAATYQTDGWAARWSIERCALLCVNDITHSWLVNDVQPSAGQTSCLPFPCVVAIYISQRVNNLSIQGQSQQQPTISFDITTTMYGHNQGRHTIGRKRRKFIQGHTLYPQK